MDNEKADDFDDFGFKLSEEDDNNDDSNDDVKNEKKVEKESVVSNEKLCKTGKENDNKNKEEGNRNEEKIDDVAELLGKKFSQSVNGHKSVLEKEKNNAGSELAVEKHISEVEETDDLQLIYKGLTDPSFSSKKILEKPDENTGKVTTKNLIEVLEDESDIQVGVEDTEEFKNEYNTKEESKKEFNVRTKKQLQSLQQKNKILVQLKTPIVVLNRLEDKIIEFSCKSYAEKLKTDLKHLNSMNKTTDKQLTNVSTPVKPKKDSLLSIEDISTLLENNVKEDSPESSIIEKNYSNDKENQSQLDSGPKRRGRKKGWSVRKTLEDKDIKPLAATKVNLDKAQPVKFSMQTRKRKLKFLPDGSLVSGKYSPSRNRIDTETSESGNETDNDFNSLYTSRPPPKRTYTRKKPTQDSLVTENSLNYSSSSELPSSKKRKPGRPKKQFFDFDTYYKERVSGKLLSYEQDDSIDQFLSEDDKSDDLREPVDAAKIKQYVGGVDPTQMLSKILDATVSWSEIDKHKFSPLPSKDKNNTLSSPNVIKRENGKIAKRGVIIASDKSGSITYDSINTTDKLNFEYFDSNPQLGGIIPSTKVSNASVKHKSTFTSNVNREKGPGLIGGIMLAPHARKRLLAGATRLNFSLSTEVKSNVQRTGKLSGIANILRNLKNNSSGTGTISSSANSSNDEDMKVEQSSVPMDTSENEEEMSDELNTPSSNATSHLSTKSNSSLISFNREDIKNKENRTVKTTTGPKKALKKMSDEDESIFTYNISDGDDRMLKIVTEDLQTASLTKSIYDLMEEIAVQMPSWNLHIMPDNSSYCIAQVARGRMGIPILKKSIELDANFSAKVYVHQLHCKRYDGIYSDEGSIVNLIKEIDALSA